MLSACGAGKSGSRHVLGSRVARADGSVKMQSSCGSRVGGAGRLKGWRCRHGRISELPGTTLGVGLMYAGGLIRSHRCRRTVGL
jgi:hypothetical protein